MDDDSERRRIPRPFAEEIGLSFEGLSISRMSGRVMGWLLVSNPPHQSAAQLAEALQACKGSISSATRTLIQIGFVERISLPGDRKTYYLVKPGVWAHFAEIGMKTTTLFKNLSERGLDLLEDEPSEIQESLQEMLHIHAFLERERPAQIERWKKEWEREKQKEGGGP